MSRNVYTEFHKNISDWVYLSCPINISDSFLFHSSAKNLIEPIIKYFALFRDYSNFFLNSAEEEFHLEYFSGNLFIRKISLYIPFLLTQMLKYFWLNRMLIFAPSRDSANFSPNSVPYNFSAAVWKSNISIINKLLIKFHIQL